MNEKAKELFNGITNIDDELIESALSATPESVKTEKLTVLAKKPWFKWASAAAAFLIIAAGVFVALEAAGTWQSVNGSETNLNINSSADENEMSGLMSSQESEDVSSDSSGGFDSEIIYNPEGEYGGTIRIRENGFDPAIIAGYDGDDMYVIRDGLKYKIELITDEEAKETALEHFKEPEIIVEDGVKYYVFNGVKNRMSDRSDGHGEENARVFNRLRFSGQSMYSAKFAKSDVEDVVYCIDGKDVSFSYKESETIVTDASRDLDGSATSYVIDYYYNEKGDYITRFTGSSELKSFCTSDWHNVYEKRITTEEAKQAGIRVAMNSSLDMGDIASAESSVIQDSVGRIFVDIITNKGSIEVAFDETGGLQEINIVRDATASVAKDRMEAAEAKMSAKLEELNKSTNKLYVLKEKAVEARGESVYEVFKVVIYPSYYGVTWWADNDVEGYTTFYYCVI